jgi:transposase
VKNLPEFTEAAILDLECALEEETEEWARTRLETMLLVAEEGGNLTAKEIAEKSGIGRATLYRWLDRFRMNAVGALLHRTYRRSIAGACEAEAVFGGRLMATARRRAKLNLDRRRAAGEDLSWLGLLGEL